MKLLIVEDEHDLLETLVKQISREGHICESAKNYRIAEDKILQHDYDMVLLDITLPDGNGIDLLKELKRKNPGAPVIIISAKNSVDDKISGLDIGADDYLTKPFHFAELNSRIKAVWRRKQFAGNSELVFDEIRVNPDTFEVKVKDENIILTKKEFDLLIYFIHNKNRVLSKEAIAEHLWGDYMEAADHFDFVYTHIKNLRKKLFEKGAGDHIKTVYGLGYKFTDH